MRNNPQYHIGCKAGTVGDLENEIHVWTYDLVQPITVLREYKGLLDERELEQYNNYYFEKEKRQYLAANGFIKKLLSQYLQTSVKEIKLSKSILGKPFLIDEVVEPIKFSVSHANELAAFSLSKEKTGIDIEYMKRTINYQKIAKTIMSNREYKKYWRTRALDSDKKRFFYDIWTRKEAAIKLLGDEVNVDQRDLMIKHESKTKKTIFKFNRRDMKKEIITYTFQPQEHYIGALATINGKIKRIFH
jgi:phosphopantetheine--protein transferase-like protein